VPEVSDEICLECSHRRGYHDGAGCTEALPDGSPCPCATCLNMPSSEPTDFPAERLRQKLMTLYCLGCGQPVAQIHPGQTLAIACRCGANAPILHAKDGSWATPFSLIQATGVKPPPHLEYYLGFSEHQSTLKTEVIRMLRALGSISYTECSDESCRQAFERSKAQWEREDGKV
ncbi:hypothetical protein LCGC14_2456260, partial [marine sediment metagenome]